MDCSLYGLLCYEVLVDRRWQHLLQSGNFGGNDGNERSDSTQRRLLFQWLDLMHTVATLGDIVEAGTPDCSSQCSLQLQLLCQVETLS